MVASEDTCASIKPATCFESHYLEQTGPTQMVRCSASAPAYKNLWKLQHIANLSANSIRQAHARFTLLIGPHYLLSQKKKKNCTRILQYSNTIGKVMLLHLYGLLHLYSNFQETARCASRNCLNWHDTLCPSAVTALPGIQDESSDHYDCLHNTRVSPLQPHREH